MSRIHSEILGKIVDLYLTVFFTEWTEHSLFDFLRNVFVEEFRIFPTVTV